MQPHNNDTVYKTALVGSWKEGLYQLVMENILLYQPFQIQIMFHQLSGNRQNVLNDMRTEIERCFYSRFCTRVVRKPRSKTEHEFMPKLFMFPDMPVWKRDTKVR